METALSVAPLGAILGKGTKALPGKDFYQPIEKFTVNGDEIAKSTLEQRALLRKMGVKVERDPTRKTSIFNDLIEEPEGITFINGAKHGEYYGEILKVVELPTPVKNPTAFTNALEHPEMATYIEKLKEMGVDVAVDTSLKESGSVGIPLTLPVPPIMQPGIV